MSFSPADLTSTTAARTYRAHQRPDELQLADRDVRARADALSVGDQGGAAVIVVFEAARDAALEQAQLAVERGLPLRRRHRLQVGEGRLEPPRHLRVAAGSEPDLVEREPDVAV